VEYALHETAAELSLMRYSTEYILKFGEEITEQGDNTEGIKDFEGFVNIGETGDFEGNGDIDSFKEAILDPVLSETLVRAIFTEKFGLDNLNRSLIKNKAMGIHFFRSDILGDDDCIDLIVTYKVEPLFNIFKVRDMTFCNRVKVHAWTGYDLPGNNEDEEYVYITESGTVYHTNPYCDHLHISINTVPVKEVGKCRNKDGKKYRACSKCMEKERDEECIVYFLTPYGEVYHSSLSCSGLKRTVYKVKISEVEGRGLCEDCASYRVGQKKEENPDESE